MIVDDPCSFRRGPPAPAPTPTPAPAAPATAAAETGPTPSAKISREAAFSGLVVSSKNCSPARSAGESPKDARVDAASSGAEPNSTRRSPGESATRIVTADPKARCPGVKRKADDTGGSHALLPQAKSKAKGDRIRGRMRLTFGQKLEILQLLSEKKMTRLEIARIYKCSDRTVSSCFANRATLEAEAGSAAWKLKSKGRRAVGFPEVDSRVLALVEAFRIKEIPVSRTTIASLGHAVKASLLSSDSVSAADKAKLMTFGASEKWAKNFVSRNGLVSKPVLFPDGVVGGRKRMHESLKKTREKYKEYDLRSISFDETGPLPKRSYMSSSEAGDTEPATPVDAKGEGV
ncbi:unnamed protein product [Scytosiphon promiscuus]